MCVAIKLLHARVFCRLAFPYDVPTKETVNVWKVVEQWPDPPARKKVTIVPLPGRNRVDNAAKVEDIGLGSQAVVIGRAEVGVQRQ